MLSRLIQLGAFKQWTKPENTKKFKTNRPLSILPITSDLLKTKIVQPFLSDEKILQQQQLFTPDKKLQKEEEIKLFQKLFSAQEQRLLLQMMLTLERSDETSFGLSAPQVSIAKRLFIGAQKIVMEETVDEETNETYTAVADTEFEVYMNPKIIDLSSETVNDIEGCLSKPKWYAVIRRPKQLRVEYWDCLGQKQTKDLEGIPARVFLHEMDHLEGINFTDRVKDKSLIFYETDSEKFMNHDLTLKEEYMNAN